MHFKDKVIWITGASSGIGRELATQFAQQGAKLILTSRRDDALSLVTQTCLSHTTNCQTLIADLYQSNDLNRLTERAINIYGHIDIVIHSAGISQRSLALNTSEAVYRQLMEINFFAPINISRYLLPHFASRKTGHIVVLSSMAGLMGFPMRTGYAAAKHALKGFFETLQTEHTIPGLEITIVSPGRINTPISVSALTAKGEQHGEMDKGQLNGIPVEDCAKKIIKGIQYKKKHIVIAKGERILWWFWWFIPKLYYRIARNKGLNTILVFSLTFLI